MALSPAVWLAAGIIIMALEIVMPGFIVFWFGAGGVLTALFVFIGILPAEEAEIQWIFFFLSSLLMLAVWQLYFSRRFKSTSADLSRDATLVNLRGKVIEEIHPGIPGKVELYTPYHSIKVWSAESSEQIEFGREIAVMDADGIRLIVKELK
jgi:hypothetical protein